MAGFFVIAFTLLWISPISGDDTALSQFSKIFTASNTFNGALAGFTLSITNLGQVVGFANRVGELVTKTLELDASPPVQSHIESTSSVAFDHVTFRNPGNKIVANDLSFNLKKSLLIMGPSGNIFKLMKFLSFSRMWKKFNFEGFSWFMANRTRNYH